MQYRTLGASGLRVSAIGLGSWLTLGNSLDAGAGTALVRRAHERGVNLFDTADVYARGGGEQALGAAIRGLDRQHLVLASKCYFPMSDDPNDRGLSRKHIHQSIEGSLRRLATGYLDLYQCHRFDADTPLAETARAMSDLVQAGKTLYWGVSQWPAERIAEVVELCRREHLHVPISNQPLYNLYERDIEAAVLPTCARLGLSQLVYSPLAQGVLSGKYGEGEAPPRDSRAADPRQNQFLGRYLTPSRLQQAQRFAALAREHGTAPSTLALAFCLRQPNVAAVLIGARSEVQLQENLAAAELPYPPDLAAAVDAVFAG